MDEESIKQELSKLTQKELEKKVVGYMVQKGLKEIQGIALGDVGKMPPVKLMMIASDIIRETRNDALRAGVNVIREKMGKEPLTKEKKDPSRKRTYFDYMKMNPMTEMPVVASEQAIKYVKGLEDKKKKNG